MAFVGTSTSTRSTDLLSIDRVFLLSSNIKILECCRQPNLEIGPFPHTSRPPKMISLSFGLLILLQSLYSSHIIDLSSGLISENLCCPSYLDILILGLRIIRISIRVILGTPLPCCSLNLLCISIPGHSKQIVEIFFA